MAFRLIERLVAQFREPPKGGQWYKIGFATVGQEEVIRKYAKEQGFENLRGFNKWMESRDWDYYDVIKVSCRD